MDFITNILSFLQSTISIPYWLLLLLLLILFIQFVDIYKKRGIIKIEKSRNLTDNEFTRSIVTTAKKITHYPEEGLTSSIITTAKKIQKEIAAKKKAAETERPIKESIMRMLFSAGGDGRLRQSIAEELKEEPNKVLRLLNEMINAKLIESRKTTFGETYYLTKVGSEYCLRQKIVKI